MSYVLLGCSFFNLKIVYEKNNFLVIKMPINKTVTFLQIGLDKIKDTETF